MPRQVAFLRAINVGGRVVKMDPLREIFESMGLTGVETFLASGNVIFEWARSSGPLERKIAAHLEKALGYEVATFLRSLAELSEVARFRPFPDRELEARGASLYVGFVAADLSPAARRALKSFSTEEGEFRTDGRQIYWLCRPGASAADFSLGRFEKALGIRATFRNMNTVRRIVSKYAAGAESVSRPRGLGSR